LRVLRLLVLPLVRRRGLRRVQLLSVLRVWPLSLLVSFLLGGSVLRAAKRPTRDG
jgi:hypothetical protein